MSNPILTDAVETILNTRDCCGNERQALREWEQENRRLTSAEALEVASEVWSQWNSSRLAAGVTAPVSPEERKQITRMMNAA